jgi:hypothetical protein
MIKPQIDNKCSHDHYYLHNWSPLLYKSNMIPNITTKWSIFPQ